jgi:hypothetical protein
MLFVYSMEYVPTKLGHLRRFYVGKSFPRAFRISKSAQNLQPTTPAPDGLDAPGQEALNEALGRQSMHGDATWPKSHCLTIKTW